MPENALRFVSYLRVSTDQQGRSGLGLEAQRAAVSAFLAGQDGALIKEFVEVESGRRVDRPELAKAIAQCRAYRVPLVVAKLDRLARDAHFLLGLQKAGVEFVACDMPSANRLTVGIMAMVAEEEARMISARTKAALAAAKACGVKLGGSRGYTATAEDIAKAREARQELARDRAQAVVPILVRIDPEGRLSLRAVAVALEAEGVPTVAGKGRWTAAGVARLRERLGAGSARPCLS